MRPLLAANIEDIEALQYPLLGSYKLDGVRAIKVGGQLLSRTQKPIPNRSVQMKFSALLPDGWDGELIYGEPTSPTVYRDTVSKVMTHEEDTDGVRFFAFDIYQMDEPFVNRQSYLADHISGIVRLRQYHVENYEDLRQLEGYALKAGYEGLILRSPDGRYKQGRSTFREGIMLKLKRCKDSEATVIDFEEQHHNANPATLDERGYTKRSSHQDNKQPTGSLGALVVNWEGHELRIGTGFTQKDRQDIWDDKDRYRGRLVKFKYLPTGIKDLPRHPVFLGWRDSIDL